MIASCTACNRHKPRQQKEPMMMHEIPTLPYEIVGNRFIRMAKSNVLGNCGLELRIL